MQIRLAKTAGFCFGVERAVALAEQTAKRGVPAVTLGPIIHNRHVVERFERMGLREIAQADEAQPGQTVIIRAHGIPVAEQRLLAERGVTVVDATCPFVKKIHVIAQKAEREGRSLLVIGTPTHPEVLAIASYSSNAHVFRTAEELQAWLTERPERRNLPFCMVSQTTGTQKLWESCREIAKKECTNCEIFDTICRATEMRQEEAAFLSKNCDAMVVVGDARSSNTGRLAMICREQCPKVALVDHADELDMSFFHGAATVGITAGASTPPWIIKEVNNKMSEELKVETAQEENFAELLEQSLKTLNNGDKFIRLYDKGDFSEYGSQSEADAALCALIAFRTGADPDAIDEVFRSSALYRSKWERDDYRENTINAGISACNGVFHRSKMEHPDFIKFNEQTGEPYVSVPLLAKYVREHLQYILVLDNGNQGLLKYVYEGGCYRLYADNMLLGIIKKYIADYDEELVKMSKVNEVLLHITTDLTYVSQDALNADEDIINFQK